MLTWHLLNDSDVIFELVAYEESKLWTSLSHRYSSKVSRVCIPYIIQALEMDWA